MTGDGAELIVLENILINHTGSGQFGGFLCLSTQALYLGEKKCHTPCKPQQHRICLILLLMTFETFIAILFRCFLVLGLLLPYFHESIASRKDQNYNIKIFFINKHIS